jgi:hypothetical protein
MRTESLLGWVVAGALVACIGCSDRAPASETDPVRCLAPGSSALTNFSIGTTYNDQVGVQSFATAFPGSLTLVASGDVIRLSGTVDNYSNLGVSFSACVDGAAYAGLAFELGGSVGPTGTVMLSVYTRENRPEPPFSATGTCVPSDPANPYINCSSAYVALPVSPAPAPTTVRFADFHGGMPAASVDPAQMLAIWFSLSWSSTEQPYPLDLTLGNVTLVH